MQIPILSGASADTSANWRVAYPRNLIPVPIGTGISNGHLRSADGADPLALNVTAFDGGGLSGVDRGGIVWQKSHYRVIGDALVEVTETTAHVVARVPGDGPVRMDYSFDRLAIVAGKQLYLFSDNNLRLVSAAGVVLDALWQGGYFVFTDGTSVLVTELNDPFSVNPLKYGSSEADPDPIVALRKLINEVYVANRFTIQVLANTGGTGFPFSLVQGALIERGAVGRDAISKFAGALAFVGSGRDESPSVYLTGSGSSKKIATGEIERRLQSLTEEQLASIEVESREHRGHAHLYLHLPEETAVYDAAASAAIGEPIWFFLSSGADSYGKMNVRHYLWHDGDWYAGSIQEPWQIQKLTDSIAGFGWEFETQVVYNKGNGFIIHSLELTANTGRSSGSFSEDQKDWKAAVQYTLDGLNWSQKEWTTIGKAGDTMRRIAWRRVAAVRGAQWIGFRFSGTQPMPVSFSRLEAEVEALRA